jgi:hypothetical protein
MPCPLESAGAIKRENDVPFETVNVVIRKRVSSARPYIVSDGPACGFTTRLALKIVPEWQGSQMDAVNVVKHHIHALTIVGSRESLALDGRHDPDPIRRSRAVSLMYGTPGSVMRDFHGGVVSQFRKLRSHRSPRVVRGVSAQQEPEIMPGQQHWGGKIVQRVILPCLRSDGTKRMKRR